mgnify:CR=1 FL=1
MTLIRRSLYRELVESRDNMLADIEKSAADMLKLTTVVKEAEDFLAGYDATQTGLEDARVKAMADLDKTQEKMDKIMNDLETAKESLSSLNDEVVAMTMKKEDREKDLLVMREENPEDERIPLLETEIDKLAGEISAKESSAKVASATVANLEASMKSSEALSIEFKISIKEYDSQIAENSQRKKDLDEGELEAFKKQLADATANNTELKAMYTEFNTKNKDTIKAFEAQQARRDANIRQEPPSKAYERVPEDAEEKAVSSIVVNEVIQEELQITDEGPEKIIRENAIEAGQDREFNPDWMSAAEARELTLKSIWSTKNIMPAIKKACLKGDYHLDFESMSNTLIYILQIHGYTVTMIDAADDARSDVRVSWEKLTDKSSK